MKWRYTAGRTALSVSGPRPKSRRAASRAAIWGEPARSGDCSATPLTRSRQLLGLRQKEFSKT
jgi:hypothetical protein